MSVDTCKALLLRGSGNDRASQQVWVAGPHPVEGWLEVEGEPLVDWGIRLSWNVVQHQRTATKAWASQSTGHQTGSAAHAGSCGSTRWVIGGSGMAVALSGPDLSFSWLIYLLSYPFPASLQLCFYCHVYQHNSLGCWGPTDPPSAVPAGAGRVHQVPTAKGGFFRPSEEAEVAEVSFSPRWSHSGNRTSPMSLTSVLGRRASHAMLRSGVDRSAQMGEADAVRKSSGWCMGAA